MSPALPRYRFAGGTAVVTGAAGGIGAAHAEGLARRGSDLVLLDRDGARLGALADRLRAAHPAVAVSTHVADLADPAATDAAADAVLAAAPRVTLLLNNAGVALAGTFEQVTFEEFWWVVEVNLRATAQLTHRLLPSLLASPGSHLVTTSSLFGLVAPAGQAAYATSKFGVRGFTEALRAELVPRGVGVTQVHPGGVNTNIARDSRVGSGLDAAEAARGARQFQKLLTIDPADASEQVLRGVERRRPRVLVGTSAKVLDVVARLAPGSYHRGLEQLGRLTSRAR